MAVWEAATYKQEIAKVIWEEDQELIEKILGDNPNNFMLHRKTIKPDDWGDIAIDLKWRDLDWGEERPEQMTWALEKVDHWAIGTEALYKLLAKFSEKRFTVKDEYSVNHMISTMIEFGKLIMPATQITPSDFKREWNRCTENIPHRYFHLANLAAQLKRLRFDFGSKVWKHSDEFKVFGAGKRDVYCYTKGSLQIWFGAKEWVNQGHVLTRAHFDLLIGMVERVKNAIIYIHTQYRDDTYTRDQLLAFLTTQIEENGRLKYRNSRKAVRAYHKAKSFACSHLFKNIRSSSMNQELIDYKKEGLHHIVPITIYANHPLINKRKAVMDLMNLYKWMPPPDYDVVECFNELSCYHKSTRKSGADPFANSDRREIWEKICFERKVNVANAYKDTTGEFPAEVALKRNKLSTSRVYNWVPENLFTYYSYGQDVITQIKDKSTVNSSMLKEWYGEGDIKDNSFLLWYLRNGKSIDTNKVAESMNKGIYYDDNYVRVAYKPEAHKPTSRLFFMAPPVNRIMMGEMEGNLARICRNYPGSLQGKTNLARERILARIMDTAHLPENTPLDEASTSFVVTFDLSKFSSRFNENVLKDYHSFWSRVYGRDIIKSLERIGPESEILHQTAGVKMKYMNKGADLEGFRGRMMTMFHSDVLAAACREAKRKGVIQGKGELATFIDDGVVKIAATGYGEEAANNAEEFLKIMQDFYDAAGQECNPNKTMVSGAGGEMLSLGYVYGRKLPSGVKAAMRMCPDYSSPVSTIVEEWDALFATAQGSVKNGGDWIGCYFLYVIACLSSLYRWSKYRCKFIPEATLCLKMITPKSFGGFGIQPFQGLVSTTTLNVTKEGLGMLNRAARYYKELRPQIKRIIKSEVRQRPPIEVLRDPGRVRTARPVLVENRMLMKVVDWLEDNSEEVAEYLGAYRNADLREHANQVAVALLSRDSVSFPLLNRAWKATPLAYVESIIAKFKQSKTIISLLGRRITTTIRRKNMNDVQVVLED